MTLDMTMDALCSLSMTLHKEIKKGLAQEGAMIKCLPTFISPPVKIRGGQVYVIELGGSNLRTALISIKNGRASIIDGPIETKMPWKPSQPFSKNDYLKIQADHLAMLKKGYGNRIGYCFSFPATPLPDKDAILLNWTKGIHVPDTIGKKAGKPLLSLINMDHQRKFEKICVVNDTIASLFSGLNDQKSDGFIGLIAGTGNNMAAFFKKKHILKLNTPEGDRTRIPINLESGNFNFPYLSDYDKIVDSQSENKKTQLFEKAVSGMYLGRLFKAAHPESVFDPATGAKGLVDMLNAPGDISKDYLQTAREIYDRSAILVASAIAGLIRVLHEHQPLKQVTVRAEGRLFWSEINGVKHYADLVRKTLVEILDEVGMPGIRVNFPEMEHATLIGTAIAALA